MLKDNGHNDRDEHHEGASHSGGHDGGACSNGSGGNQGTVGHNEGAERGRHDEHSSAGEHGQHNSNSGSSTVTTFVAKELLIDGSFEQANVGANTWTHQKTVGGWKSDTEVEVWGKGFYGIKATEGQKFAELDFDGKQSNIYQEIKTDAGTEYSFSFDYMKRPDSKAGSDTIEVYFNGKMVGKVDPAKSEWAKAEFKVIGTGGNDKIEFREEAGDNDSYGGLLDNASFKSTGRVEKEKAENAVKVAAEKAAAEKAAAEKAAAEKAAAEKAAAEKAAAAKAAAEKAAAEKAAAEKAAAEKAAAEKAAAEKAAAAKAAAEKAAAEKAAAEKAAAEKAAAEKAAAEKAAAEKAAAEKAAAEKAAAEKAAAEKAAAEKAAAEKAAAEKAAAEKAAAEKAAAEKAAAEKAAAEKAAAEKAAAEKAAAEKAAAEKAAAEKAAAEKAAAEKAAAEKAAAEKAAAEKAAAEKAAAEKAAAEKAAAEKAAAEKAEWEAAHRESITLTTADASSMLAPGKVINGTDGVDTLTAESSNDQVYGGKDDDRLQGVDKTVAPVSIAISGELINAADANAIDFVVAGVPDGVSLSAGAKGIDGNWHLTKADLAGLTLNGVDSGEVTLLVTANATDGSGLTASSAIKVSVDAQESNLLVGGHGNDGIVSSSHGDDVIYGGSGPGKHSTHNTVADNDIIKVGSGHVIAYGQGGNDVIFGGTGTGLLNGGDGNDTIVAGGGNYFVTGGAGFDTIDFSKAGQGVNVDLHNHSATGFGNLTVKGMDAIIGSSFDDVLFGGKNGSVLTGGAGDDVFGVHKSDAKAGAVTHVTDFSAGDRLNLSELLKGRTDAKSLSVTDAADGTHVAVRVGGTMQDVAVLDNVHGMTAQDMLAQGMILA